MKECVAIADKLRVSWGRPRKWPEKQHADKGYDFPHCRKTLRKRGIKARIAIRGVEPSERPERHRWLVERTLSWLKRFRRLKAPYERQSFIRRCWNWGAR